MGPLDFVLYTGPLSDVIRAHKDIQYVIYADDTQLYLVLKPCEQSQAIKKLEASIADVRAWAINNKLMLNDAKTENVHVNSQFRMASKLPSVNISGAEIESSSSAKDLGVIIDNHLRMREHIRIICRSAS